MRYLLNYFWHFLTSHSRHGTHSPFVYALAERAVYTKQKEQFTSPMMPDGRYTALLNRILHYFQIQQVIVFDKISAPMPPNEHPKQILMLCAYDVSNIDLDDVLSAYEFVVVKNIYESKLTKMIWLKIVQQHDVTVSIDFFHFGLLFRRTGQVKEHFRLRFPFWLE